MERTAFLHIGPHKTGSTALQGAFAESRERLAAAGITYPGADANHSIWLASIFWKDAEAAKLGQLHWIDDIPAFEQWREIQKAALTQAITAAPQHHLLLSGEELSRFTEEEVKALVEFLAPHFSCIRVVAYARPPISCITSMTQQRAKWTGNSLATLLDSPALPNNRRRFGPWLSAVGRKNFELRTYGTRHEGFDILTDFCQALGLAVDVLASVPESRANMAISWPSVIALAHINELAPSFINNRHSPVRAYQVVSATRLPGSAFIMPRECLAALHDQLEDDRAHLNELLGAEIIKPEPLPNFSRDEIDLFDPPSCEALGKTLHEALKERQNEKALRGLIRARHRWSTSPQQAETALTQAMNLATDRWSLRKILEAAREYEHPQLKKGLARLRLMRLIEAPSQNDPPLLIGNQFDRF